MNAENDDFQRRLIETFRVEAGEHISALSAGLIELETAEDEEGRRAIIETVYREAHSLKGAARSVALTEIERPCQALEDVFAALKRNEIAIDTALMDLLHEAIDRITALVAGEAAGAPERRLIKQLREAAARRGGEWARPGKKPGAAETSVTEPRAGITAAAPALSTVRIPTERLDTILLETEELLAIKLSTAQRAAELRELDGLIDDLRKRGGTISASEALQIVDVKLHDARRGAERDHRSFGALVDVLLDDMKNILMLPFSSTLEAFPKFLRDLARQQGKEIEIVVKGTEVEVDRRILQELKDPLIHLVRNSVDHGIEEPEARQRSGKPRRGTIAIEISQLDASKVEVSVSDDGRGISPVDIRAAAISQNLITPERAEEASDDEVFSLMFQSGFSTSPAPTEISGRGLGLAIVREKVENLNGSTAIESSPGKGSKFRLILPLTLATYRGILIRVGDRHFVAPTINVDRAVRIDADDIRTAEGRETITLDGRALSLVRLADLLGLPAGDPFSRGRRGYVLVLSAADRRIAFLVDEILNEQEVLVKGLGRQLQRVRNFTGAAVLGSNRVVPILSVPDLIKTSAQRGGSILAPAAISGQTAEGAPADLPRLAEKRRRHAEGEPSRVLIVEDSVTARMLLKNILQAAGYRVKTAVDGSQALTLLHQEHFDLIVSDVQMPKMDGLQLTAEVRADPDLTELPVVLVTALDSREDRERGLQVGANAYIVKSSFDQGDLLDAVRTLVA